jgi:diacylglycerol kinase (ATP)
LFHKITLINAASIMSVVQQTEALTPASLLTTTTLSTETTNTATTSTSSAPNVNTLSNEQSPINFGGHIFSSKKSFGKLTYCHHCCDKIWGMLSQGYLCEVCNFVCHATCMRSIVTVCTGQMMQLIKNPVAHTWTDPQHIKRHFCCVCRKRTDDTSERLSSECEVCSCYVHVDCRENKTALADCREASTYVPSLDRTTSKQFHHMREGNLTRDAKCVVCKKGCYSAECLSGFRCQWCNLSVHSTCYRQFRPQCDFGPLRKIVLPPNAVTTPRAELPMDLLLNIHTTTVSVQNDKEGRKASSPARPIHFDDKEKGAERGERDRERDPDKDDDDQLLLRIFDGNSSLRNKISRTAYVPKTASCEQIRDIALRCFHICDVNRENYYVTQAPHEFGDEEEPLEDPIPLRNVKKPEGKCAQIFLRYRDDNSDKAIIRIYGGWLRIPCEYTDLTVTGRMVVQECIQV